MPYSPIILNQVAQQANKYAQQEAAKQKTAEQAAKPKNTTWVGDILSFIGGLATTYLTVKASTQQAATPPFVATSTDPTNGNNTRIQYEIEQERLRNEQLLEQQTKQRRSTNILVGSGIGVIVILLFVLILKAKK